MKSARIAAQAGDIVCPQAMSHLEAAAREPLGAAEEYVRTKCSRGDIEQRCRDAGVVFQPLIFESFGGVSEEAMGVLRCINKAVADINDSAESEVATRFWQRIGVRILRGICRAFSRRVVGRFGVGDAFGDAGGLHIPEGM